MNIAIIGYKNHASRLILMINSLSTCSKLTIFHPNKRKLINSFELKNLKFEVVLTDSLDDLFKSSCIFIASPTPSHFDYITKILPRYNGYIFCEKPPCSSINEANKLLSLSSNDKKRVYFNFNYRFSELSKFCKKAISNKTYGNLISLEFYSSQGMAFKADYKNNWRNNPTGILENIIGNVGIHYIDLINYLLSEVEISSVSSIKVSSISTKFDSSLITVTSKECLPATIFLSYAAPFQNSAKITFSDGIVELSNGKLTIAAPRDSFDTSGMFKSPNKRIIKDFKNSREYFNDSLLSSVRFFTKTVKSDNKLNNKDFDCSIKTCQNILSL